MIDSLVDLKLATLVNCHTQQLRITGMPRCKAGNIKTSVLAYVNYGTRHQNSTLFG